MNTCASNSVHACIHAGLAASSHNMDILPDLLSANPSVVNVTFTMQAQTEVEWHMSSLDEHEALARSDAFDTERLSGCLTTPRVGGHSEFLSMNVSGITHTSSQTTILCWCIREKCVALIKKLIDLHVDVNMPEPATGNTPLMLVSFLCTCILGLSVPRVLKNIFLVYFVGVVALS